MRWLVPFSFLLPLTISTAAFADGDNKNCPPGSWFCESISIGGGGDPDAAKTPEPTNGDLATSPDDAPAKKRRARPRVDPDMDGPEVAAPDGDPDTVVIVRKRRPHRTRVVARDREMPEGMRGPRRERWREHFGLNLRVEGAAFIPRNGDDLAGMGGAGASFRWRPSPFFAFDLGGDIVGGNDYNGDGRVEFAGSLSGLLYFNPQHRVQVYAIGGLHLSHAEVGTTCYDTMYPTDTRYGYDYYGGCGSSSRNYFGGQFGLGLEFRIARHFGLFADALGIIRTRIDDSSVPEFTDPATGDRSNTSGAMLMRTGVNFWW